MKKIALLFALTIISFSITAQPRKVTSHEVISSVSELSTRSNARTTAIGDTIHLSHIGVHDTLALYKYADGGYVTGTNSNGDRGFAERYDFNGNDSSMRVLGVMAQFGGKVNPSTTNTVSFKLWAISAPTVITSSLVYEGFPKNSFDTLVVPFTQLGIGSASDTLKSFYFDTASITLNGSFFVGYDMNYALSTVGDTIGLATSLNGHRNMPVAHIDTFVDDFEDTTIDKTINVVNATQWSDGNWHENYTQNDSMFNNLAIYPIVAILKPTGIAHITRNGLSLFGCYPNPANDQANIKYSLSKNTGVTIQLRNMQGLLVQEIRENELGSGEHVSAFKTSNLPAGNYVYLVLTDSGDGIAGQLTIR